MRSKKSFNIIMICILIVLSFFSMTTKSYAKAGDFYKDHKKEIEEHVKSKDARSYIKDYDYSTNTFDCGALDISCKAQSLFSRSAIGWVKIGYEGLKSTVISPSDIMDNSTFKKYKNAFGTLSTSMMAVFLSWQIIKIMAQRYADFDDGNIAISGKVVTVIGSAILLGVYDSVFTKILTVQSQMVKAILGTAVTTKELVLIILIKEAGYGILIGIILSAAIGIFSVIWMYRFVLFGLLYMVGVIAIPTAVNEEFNFFSLWIRLLISNAVTIVLQTLCFSIGLVALVKNEAFNSGTSFVTAMAFFVLAIAIPSLLGNFGASTGTSRALGTTVKYLVRK